MLDLFKLFTFVHHKNIMHIMHDGLDKNYILCTICSIKGPIQPGETKNKIITSNFFIIPWQCQAGICNYRSMLTIMQHIRKHQGRGVVGHVMDSGDSCDSLIWWRPSSDSSAHSTLLYTLLATVWLLWKGFQPRQLCVILSANLKKVLALVWFAPRVPEKAPLVIVPSSFFYEEQEELRRS